MRWRLLVLMGKILFVMEISFLSWNMRGSNSTEKLHTVKRLIGKHKPAIVGLQETKRNSISITVARFLWGDGAHNYVVVPANGASGGITLMWDVDKVKVHEVARGHILLPY